MVTHTLDGFNFVLSEGSQCILVFKGDALANHQCYPSRIAAEEAFEKVKKATHVILDCEKEKVKQ